MRKIYNLGSLSLAIIAAIFGCTSNNELELYPREKFVDTVKTGLIAHYTFDNTTNDISGNELAAITHSKPIYTFDRFGEELKSIYLNGLTDYITAFIGKHDSISISVWIYPDFDNNVNSTLVEYGYQTFHAQQCDATSGPTTLRWSIKTTYNNEESIQTSSYYDYSQWHHIYFEAGSSITPSRIFINGGMIAQFDKIIEINVVLDILYIGRSLSAENSNSSFYHGKIDDLRIYDRPLTEMEIKNLSNETNEKSY